MNAKEFEEWFRYHKIRFTAVDSMLDKAASGPDSVSAKEVKMAWASTLRSCRLDDAKAATDAMHAGLEGEPGWPDRHPAKVAEICRRLAASRRQSAPVYHGRDQAFRCLLCEDYGWVHCWPHEAVAEFHQTGRVLETIGLQAVARPCCCEAGNDRAKCFPTVRRYDPYWTLPLGVGGVDDPREQETLRDWLAKRKPKNYENAFNGYETAER
jgi:hypothetical protein